MIKIKKEYNGQDLSKEWVNKMKKELKKALKGLEDYDGKICLNAYYFSGFINKNGKYVYISSVDTRFWSDWKEQILIRYAKNDRDYIGGSNSCVSMSNLANKIKKMLD